MAFWPIANDNVKLSINLTSHTKIFANKCVSPPDVALLSLSVGPPPNIESELRPNNSTSSPSPVPLQLLHTTHTGKYISKKMAIAKAFSVSPVAAVPPKDSESLASVLRFYSPTSNSTAYYSVTPRVHLSKKRNVASMCASVDGVDSLGSMSLKSLQDNDSVPMPIVLIDQDSDPEATIVQVSFGDRLGALLDTMKALKDLGLDVMKGIVTTENSVKQTKFFITRVSGRKVEDPDLLEGIRLTIINNLLKYHPESSERLALGEVFGIRSPEQKVAVNISTHIHVKADGPRRSLLCVETADRPGLLLEMMKIMNDVNVNVESAEIETEGLVAKDKFHVSYGGAALNTSLSQVLINCLRYYLRTPETEDDSY